MLVACDRASSQLFEGVARGHARAARERRRECEGRGKMGELATISHKFSFPPRRPSPLGRRLICWLPN